MVEAHAQLSRSQTAQVQFRPQATPSLTLAIKLVIALGPTDVQVNDQVIIQLFNDSINQVNVSDQVIIIKAQDSIDPDLGPSMVDADNQLVVPIVLDSHDQLWFQTDN